METAIDGFVAIYFALVGVLGLFGLVALVLQGAERLVKAVTGE